MVYVIKEKGRVIIPRETWIQAGLELLCMAIVGLVLYFGIRFFWSFFPDPYSYAPMTPRSYAQDNDVVAVNPSISPELRFVPEWNLTIEVPSGAVGSYNPAEQTYIVSSSDAHESSIVITAYFVDETDVQEWYLRTFGPENTMFESFSTASLDGILATSPDEMASTYLTKIDASRLLVVRSKSLGKDQLKNFVAAMHR